MNPHNSVKTTSSTFSCNNGLPTSTFSDFDLPYTNINIKNLNSNNQISDDWVDHPADVWPEVSC